MSLAVITFNRRAAPMIQPVMTGYINGATIQPCYFKMFGNLLYPVRDPVDPATYLEDHKYMYRDSCIRRHCTKPHRDSAETIARPFQ
jgi:hypothetical protein